MQLNIKSIDKDGFLLEVRDDIVYISGNIKIPSPYEVIGPFFKEVHEEIIKNKLKTIKIDMRNLKYMNSASIKQFVNWILSVETLSEEKKYLIIFIYNQELQWQETFVSSMVYLNKELVKKENI